MDGKKAVGIDGITKGGYSAYIEENLEMLERRIKNNLVKEALRCMFKAVFKPHFYEEMMGFRPGRGCH